MKLFLWPGRGRTTVSAPARDVFAALALKGVLLLAIYLMFFNPSHHLPPDVAAIANALVGTNSSGDAQ
jgi:hypothetical protein